MSISTLQHEWASAYLSGGNMAYVDGLYEDYLQDEIDKRKEVEMRYQDELNNLKNYVKINNINNMNHLSYVSRTDEVNISNKKTTLVL